jgi:transposase InsO family protein/transposase-like protein
MAFIGGDMSNHRLRGFSTAFKEGIVRRLESGEALAAVSKELGIARKLLYEWRWAWRRHGAAGLNRRRGPKAGLRRKMATGDPPGARAKARIEELERLVGRQQLDLDFFRKALRLADALQGLAPARGETNSAQLIKDLSAAKKSQGENETTSAPEKATHEVQHLCQLAQLSRAGYYRHFAPHESKRDDADIRDAIHRAALFDRFYGYRRVTKHLEREGLVVNSKRVRRLMWLDNLLSLRYKPFVPRTTDSAHGYEIVGDLTREAMLTAPDHVWVADITYIRLAEEFVYLAGVMDAFSRKVVGWALADHLQASLPLEALDKAIASRGGSLKDLIHQRLRPAPETDRRPRQHEPPRHAAGQRQGRELHGCAQSQGGRRQSLSEP